MPRPGSGQHGDLRVDVPGPEPRFVPDGEAVCDRLIHLQWRRRPDLDDGPVTWAGALHLRHGALGAGRKHGPHFRVWAVRYP